MCRFGDLTEKQIVLSKEEYNLANELDTIGLEHINAITVAVDKLNAFEVQYEQQKELLVTVESIVSDIKHRLKTENVNEDYARSVQKKIAGLNIPKSMNPVQVSFESYKTPEEYLTVTQEGLGNVLWAGFQGWLVFWMQGFDVVADLLKSSTSAAMSYRGRLKNIEDYCHNKFNGNHVAEKSMDMSGVWMMIGKLDFKTAPAFGRPNFKEEFELCNYINKTYPDMVFNSMDKYCDIVSKGNYNSFETVKSSIVSKLIASKHPHDYFDKKYIIDRQDDFFVAQKYPYMGFTAILESSPKTIKNPSHDKDIYKLQQEVAKTPIALVRCKVRRALNGLRYIPHFGNLTIAAMKSGAHLGENIANLISPSVVISSTEINDMLKETFKYVDIMLQENHHFSSKLQATKNKLNSVQQHLNGVKPGDKNAEMACKVIEAYGKSLFDCLKYPMTDNIPRMLNMIRGMMYYVNFAAMRL